MDQTSGVFAELAKLRVVPVVSESDPDKARRLADALVEGGLPVVELALRAEGAIEALRAVAERPDLLAIAGTVLTPDQVDAAADAGVKMIVSPGLSEAVVRRAHERGVPVCPGVATASEVQNAVAMGLTTLKFFPAGAIGGVGTLKALSAPFPMVRFMPTGGVSAANLRDYLSVPSVVACGGSWMVKPDLYADGDFGPVVVASREAVAIANDQD